MLTLGASLPSDLLERILGHLDAQDIIICTQISRLFNYLIHSSIVLQYRIACYAAGVIDNPYCKLSYAERYQALLKRENAWKTLRPVFTKTFDVPHEPCPTYGLTAGVYLSGEVNEQDLQYCLLPSMPSDVLPWTTIHGNGPGGNWDGLVVDFGTAIHEHDLIINVVFSPATFQENLTQSLEMILLQFSTGEYHPQACRPRIYLQDLDFVVFPYVVLEIVGDNVAMIIDMRGLYRDKLFVFDWKSGSKILEHEAMVGTYSSLAFVSPEILLVFDNTKHQYEVWQIPKDGIPYRSLYLCFPALSHGLTLSDWYGYGAPNPYLHDQPYAPPRPFHTSGDDTIIVNTLYFSINDERDSRFTLVMHRRSLLRTISNLTPFSSPDPQREGSSIESIPWSKWGPPISRWFARDLNDPMWITTSSGQRWAVLNNRRIRIIDFNPYNIHHVRDDLPGELIVRQKGEFMQRGNTFVEDIEMGLGCIEYTAPEVYDFDCLLMEDERLLGVNKASGGRPEKVTVFYFG